MKTYKLSLFAAIGCLLLSSCVSQLSYLGESYPVNQNVKVYYDVHDIKRDYKVIGHVSCPVMNNNEESAKNEMIGKAKSVGADAIVFTGMAYTGGKDSSPVEKADVIKYTDEEAAKPAAGN